MAITRSLAHRFPPNSLPSLFHSIKSPHPSTPQTPSLHHTRRTLILESAPQPVSLHRLSDSDSGIIEVKLERPEVKNAISMEVVRGLQRSFEAISKDASARIVMICSSVPRVFCAGADLKERKTMKASEVLHFVTSLRSTLSFLEELPIPTIAVIDGPAMGGGFEMALACDLRICGEDAVMSFPETGLAIMPGVGGTQRLPRLVGKSIAKELIFTGRKIGSREALSLGLINHCVPAGEAHSKALEIARNIKEKSPLAIKVANKAINGAVEMDKASSAELEDECYKQLMHTKDRLEGLAAFAEKRKPRYTGE